MSGLCILQPTVSEGKKCFTVMVPGHHDVTKAVKRGHPVNHKVDKVHRES